MKVQKYKLVPDLVPRSLWGKNIRNSVPHNIWRKEIRQKVILREKNVCQGCGAIYEKRMICHEVWNYDHKNHIAKLSGFSLICGDCNLVFHFGFASTKDLEDKAIQHMMHVNSISEEEALRVIDAAIEVFNQRSLIDDWEISLSQEVKEEFPFLSL